MTAPNFQSTNFAISTLAGTLTSADTTGTLALGTGALFPALSAGQVFAGILTPVTGNEYEIVYVTARSGDVITMERGQESSTAQSWTAGSNFINGITAGQIEQALQVGNPTAAQIDIGGQRMSFIIPVTGGGTLTVNAGIVSLNFTDSSVQASLLAPWPTGFLGGVCTDGGTAAYQYGLSVGTSNDNVTIDCPSIQILRTAPGSFFSRSTAQGFYLAWGY